MALSNLIWWPWFGFTRETPVVSEELPMGDRRVHHEIIRTRAPSEDEEIMLAVILSER